ncbi:MAG: U32 family peptidase C-terminal domain-containing protein, partial [Bacilli bacterium]
TKIATLEQRNYFEVGEVVEIFGPKLNNTEFNIKEMFDEKMNSLDVARHPLQIIKIEIPFELSPGDMIRKVTN